MMILKIDLENSKGYPSLRIYSTERRVTRAISTVTLLTDFGLKDHYVGVMKGVMLSINPSVQIVDISHLVPAHDILSAAFLVPNYYSYFPPRTIHLVVADPGVGSERFPILLKSEDYFFLGPDNGTFTLIYQTKKIEKIIRLVDKGLFLSSISSTFHGRDIFAPIAAHLSLGMDEDLMGEEIKEIVTFSPEEPLVENGNIMGKVTYVDGFGNLITNIPKPLFLKETEGTNFEIIVGENRIREIKNCYWDGKEGGLIALFASTDLLEIATREGNTESLTGIGRNHQVIVKVINQTLKQDSRIPGF